MTIGRDRCRCHPGSKNRPWNVERASAGALRPPPPGLLAKASLRKTRPVTVRLESAGCNARPGWFCRLSLGATRADAAGGCAPSRGWRPGCSPSVGWAGPGPPRPSICRLSWAGATTVCSLGVRRALPPGAEPPEGRASWCGAGRCASGAARGADVTRGAAARGACGATRGAAMCGAAARGGGAARAAAAAGCGPGAGCAPGGAPGGFAVAEVAAMPAARIRTAALRMLDCNMIPAPALSPRVNSRARCWLRMRSPSWVDRERPIR